MNKQLETPIRSGSAKVSETKYYPYGVTQEGGDDKYLYTGKELDRGTGLYYYEARYYNPNVGRFVQPDTLIPDVYNPQSLNRYSYVLNNPLRYIDSGGHWYTPGVFGGAVITVGGALALATPIGAAAVGIGLVVTSIGVVAPKEAGPAVDKVLALSSIPVISPAFALASATKQALQEKNNEDEFFNDIWLLNDIVDITQGAKAVGKMSTKLKDLLDIGEGLIGANDLSERSQFYSTEDDFEEDCDLESPCSSQEVPVNHHQTINNNNGPGTSSNIETRSWSSSGSSSTVTWSRTYKTSSYSYYSHGVKVTITTTTVKIKATSVIRKNN